MKYVTTIELKKTTHTRLKSIGGMTESFDDVVNRLCDEHDEINKHIDNYVDKTDVTCIDEVILGRRVIANHHFCSEDGKCNKCGLQKPKKLNAIIKQGENKEL